MVNVTKAKAAANGAALTAAAGRLFRERGVDGVGVVELCRAAGLSQGALYARFPSKQALLVEALVETFAAGVAKREVAIGTVPSLDGLLDFHLSKAARDDIAGGCPLAAGASEAGRWDVEAQAAFTTGFGQMAAAFEEVLARKGQPDGHRRSVGVMAAIVGAMAMSRSVKRTDPGLADEMLASARDMIVAYLADAG